MMKKIAFLILMALPISVFAQDKLAYVDPQAILQVMPELSEIETTLADLNEQYKKEIDKMLEEYYAKAKEYQDSQTTMAESIKAKRQSELSDMEKRIGTFQQQAMEDLQQKQQELLNVLEDKIFKAIADVGDELNYTYIFNKQTLTYQSAKAVDVTPLVKKKLGIK